MFWLVLLCSLPYLAWLDVTRWGARWRSKLSSERRNAPMRLRGWLGFAALLLVVCATSCAKPEPALLASSDVCVWPDAAQREGLFALADLADWVSAGGHFPEGVTWADPASIPDAVEWADAMLCRCYWRALPACVEREHLD